MNIKSLAKLAGVSTSTISKVFSDSKEVSQKTKDKVIKIAKEHGCYEKYNKNKFPKRVIGVICPEINGDYYNATVTYLSKLIEEQGDIMTLSVSNFNPSKTAEIFNYYSSYIKTDAVIVIGNISKVENPQMVPTVAIESNIRKQGISSIKVDVRKALKQAVLHLYERGCDTIGFAGETLTKSKITSFKKTLNEVGVGFYDKFIKTSTNRFEQAGVDDVNEWIKEGSLPKGIIAAYDFVAIGCIKALKENGYRVPEDVAVIGMDDVARAEYLETPLSSIHYSMRSSCKLAMDMLNEKFKNKYYMSGSLTMIDAGFVPRKSSDR
ncbi:MAG: LacI family DNA-binding transcriptional regulator [Clostridia bacterium]|nr:LacI family DNA-binding transcriptional regulator [Clostridia bacterium]